MELKHICWSHNGRRWNLWYVLLSQDPNVVVAHVIWSHEKCVSRNWEDEQWPQVGIRKRLPLVTSVGVNGAELIIQRRFFRRLSVRTMALDLWTYSLLHFSDQVLCTPAESNSCPQVTHKPDSSPYAFIQAVPSAWDVLFSLCFHGELLLLSSVWSWSRFPRMLLLKCSVGKNHWRIWKNPDFPPIQILFCTVLKSDFFFLCDLGLGWLLTKGVFESFRKIRVFQATPALIYVQTNAALIMNHSLLFMWAGRENPYLATSLRRIHGSGDGQRVHSPIWSF